MAKSLSKLDKVLLEAIHDEDYEKVALCLQLGANVNARTTYDTALQEAVKRAVSHDKNHTDIVRLLLETGADINARDKYGDTALHEAVGTFANNPDVISLLLEKGADINAQDKRGISVLHRAVNTNRRISNVSLLLEKGADVHLQDKDGWTALHSAAINSGDAEIIESLLQCGADVNAKTEKGETPLDFVNRRKSNYSIMLDSLLLLDYGAIPTEKHLIADIMRPAEAAAAYLIPFSLRSAQKEDADEKAAMYSFFARIGLIAKSLVSAQENTSLLTRIGIVTKGQQQAQEQNKYDTEYWCEKMITNALLNHKKSGKSLSWDALAIPLMSENATDCINIGDMVNEFTESVLLPALLHPLLEQGGKDTPANAQYLEKLKSADLRKRLIPIAAESLLSGLPPHLILGVSTGWHHFPNTMPQELRPLTGGQWHALTRDIPVPDTIAQGWTLHCICDSDELIAEGTQMNHCAGTYSSFCKEGVYHVYSLRDAKGNPVITLGLDKNLKVHQNLGYNNAAPSAKAQEAGEWFEKALATGDISVASQRGETEESKQFNTAPPVIKTIGFWPTVDNMATVFRHYTSDKMRAIVWNEEQNKFVSREPRLVYQQQEQRNPAWEERKLAELQRTDIVI